MGASASLRLCHGSRHPVLPVKSGWGECYITPDRKAPPANTSGHLPRPHSPPTSIEFQDWGSNLRPLRPADSKLTALTDRPQGTLLQQYKGHRKKSEKHKIAKMD